MYSYEGTAGVTSESEGFSVSGGGIWSPEWRLAILLDGEDVVCDMFRYVIKSVLSKIDRGQIGLLVEQRVSRG